MHQHFLIYKPYRMLSQFMTNDRHQRNKRFLGELYKFPDGVMPVGRLDETSEGLLLITTDGKYSHRINKTDKVEKEYYALLDGIISNEAIEKLKNGVQISIEGKKYHTNKCDARILNKEPTLPATTQKIRDELHGATSWISITITEGKFRQVRKMTSAVGYPTLRLARVRIGDFTIADLKGTTVRKLEL